ncbi:hypothetical protein [Caulobacter sp. NIBR2454]|uniref:hypothetical protein n=1 Tax=Caulobacter sp. NIBR2454 TaxID=3015996 RepID=UPI0022B73410|nr:hypothetical protein [Caulobacter sp. NIBR2454]
MTYVAGAKAPWHLWLVGVIALAWNGFGGFDYIMTQTENAGYLAAFTPEQRAYFTDLPIVIEVAWAMGVWSAVVASILLLLRIRWAFHAFTISLAAIVVSFIYGQFFTNAAEIMGPQGVYMPLVVAAIGAFLTWYTWSICQKGVLR